MIKHLSLFFIILCLFTFGALIAPKPPDDLQRTQCFLNIEIKKPAIITLNCDSSVFMELTNHPGRLFEVNNTRQSRPGLSFIGFLFTPFLKPIEHLIDILHPQAKANEIGRADLHPKEDLVAYSALVLVNILIVLMSYGLYQASLDPSKSFKNTKLSTPAFLISFMLIVNEITKTYVLSPHTQLLNLTIPILSVWIAYCVYYKPPFGTLKGYLISFILGLVMLVYLNAVCPFAILMSIGAFVHFQKYKFSKWGTFMRQSLLKTILFILPTLTWYFTVLHITGSYYVHEIGYVDWIHDSFLSGGVLAVLGGYLHSMILMLKISSSDFIPTLLLLGATVIWAFPEIRNNKDFRQALGERLLLSLWVEFMLLGLFSSMAFYPPRLCYSLIPVWWPLIGYMTNYVYQRKTYLFNPKIFSMGIGLSLFLYGVWILSTPWDFRMW